MNPRMRRADPMQHVHGPLTVSAIGGAACDERSHVCEGLDPMRWMPEVRHDAAA